MSEFEDRQPKGEYQIRLDARRASLASAMQAHTRLGNLRVFGFLLLLAMAGAAFGRDIFSAWWLIAPLTALVVLGRRMQRIEAKISHFSRAVAFYEDGLARLDGQWSGRGSTGARFADAHHLYSADLDILGPASLFEFLSRARTERGEDTLAGWLLEAAPSDVVIDRQRSVVEMAPRLDLREELALAGDETRSARHADSLTAWGGARVRRQPTLLQPVAWGLSLLGAAAAAAGAIIILAAFGFILIPDRVFVSLRLYALTTWAVCLVTNWALNRQFEAAIDDVFRHGHDLTLISGLLHRIEAERFTTPYLTSLRAKIAGEGEPASRRIARLNRLVKLLKARQDVLMKLVGPLLLWTFHIGCAVDDWRRESGPAIDAWLRAVGGFEAVSSLACYTYERPDNVFPALSPPTLSPEPSSLSPLPLALFEAEGLRHPLLPAERAVANDVTLNAEHRMLVVSGSNMSGKSTLLRAIGVNAVLAHAGAPVAARRLRLSRLTVGASIRVQDSLQEGTSRFYAEILRLGAIMKAATERPPVLFLIDEFLHGTNSHDRLVGAAAVTRGLLDRGAIGLITTHDLALTRIVDSLNGRAANVHFQDEIENGRMRFDYRLREGIVEHSNALALMRSVGLDV